MADICTVVSVGMTLMGCMSQPVCAPDPQVPNAVVCRAEAPSNACNHTIETLSCKREDGTTYTTTIKR